ncbi:hypothetical protein [Paractinoplanes toevensis]|uniref:Uncharacterized protein n=1 Tax=Paractinoplanes toevensis TaxID=571911 RepID=A0A919W7S0_9ACTN|nr:hypothetical protein [Actinoplanes toevensis]GIM90066.1 hypothetical protein Ato02nite_018590 [Actinoplanes toevensis]
MPDSHASVDELAAQAADPDIPKRAYIGPGIQGHDHQPGHAEVLDRLHAILTRALPADASKLIMADAGAARPSPEVPFVDPQFERPSGV